MDNRSLNMEKMLIVQLRGGLGNQMFQYAFGRALQERVFGNVSVRFDRSWFDLPNEALQGATPRSYALGCFQNLKLAFATSHEISVSQGISHWHSPLSRITRMINHLFHTRFQTSERRDYVYRQNCYCIFEPEVFNSSKSYFEGFWQNELYFSELAGKVRPEFAFDKQYDDFNADVVEKILASDNATAIHVRGGILKSMVGNCHWHTMKRH